MPTQANARPRLRRHGLTPCGFTLVEIMIVVLIIGVLLNIALPAMVSARNTSQSKACLRNLRTLSASKEQYALENRIASNDPTPIVWSNLQPYMRGNQPTCPTNYPGQNTYTLGNMATAPLCTYGGPIGQPSLAHVLPP